MSTVSAGRATDFAPVLWSRCEVPRRTARRIASDSRSRWQLDSRFQFTPQGSCADRSVLCSAAGICCESSSCIPAGLGIGMSPRLVSSRHAQRKAPEARIGRRRRQPSGFGTVRAGLLVAALIAQLVRSAEGAPIAVCCFRSAPSVFRRGPLGRAAYGCRRASTCIVRPP